MTELDLLSLIHTEIHYTRITLMALTLIVFVFIGRDKIQKWIR